MQSKILFILLVTFLSNLSLFAEPSYKRLSGNNNIFYSEPRWLTKGTTKLSLDPQKLIQNFNPGNSITIQIIGMPDKELKTVTLFKKVNNLYEGSIDLSSMNSKDFYIFYSFNRKGKTNTVYFRLAESEEEYNKDISEVEFADQMTSMIAALRAEMEKKQKQEEEDRKTRELEELRKAKEEKVALEKKLKEERELLNRQKMEEDRILKFKEAERQRQVYEQRLAEERAKKLKEDESRRIKERERQIAEMQKKHAAQIKQSKDLTEKGQEEIINGEYDAAIKILEQAILLNNTNTDAQFYKGVAFYYLDKRDEAFKILTKIEEENPGYTEVHFFLGSLLFKNNNYGGAIVEFKTSIEKNIKVEDSKFFIGLSYYKMEEFKKALEVFKPMAATDNAKKETAYLYEGLCYYRSKDYAKAIKIFEKLFYEGEDASIAEQAEIYLAKAQAMKRFEDRKSKLFKGDLSLGMFQNSNVTSTADKGEAPASGKSSSGNTVSASLAYLPYYNETWDSNVGVEYSSQSLSNKALKSYETKIMGLRAEIKYRSIFKRPNKLEPDKPKTYPYSFNVSFNYTKTYMDFDPSKSGKELYSVNKGMTPALMVIYDETDVGTYSIPFGMDDSFADDNKDARLYGVSYTHLHFLTKDKDKTVSGNLNVNINAAVGPNEYYTNEALTGGYSQTLPWYKILGTSSLAYGLKNYSKSDKSRKDTFYKGDLSFSKDLYLDNVTIQIFYSYLKNNSNLKEFAYSGWNAGINLMGSY